MTLPRTPPVRRFGHAPPAPRRHHDSKKRLHHLVRGHEGRERPFDPAQPPTWRGSSRDLVANPVPGSFRGPVELYAFTGRDWKSVGRRANVRDAEGEIDRLTRSGWSPDTIFRIEQIGADPGNPSATPQLRLNPGGFHADLTELVTRYHGKLNTELSVEEMVSDLERAFKEEDTDDALAHASDLLEGFGVEALGPVNMHDGPPYLYINFGDTYDPTIMFSREDNKVFVAMGGWGDVWSEEGEANLFDEEWDSHIASEFNHELESEAAAVEPLDDEDEPSDDNGTGGQLQARVLELIDSDEQDTKELFQEALYRVQRRGATGSTKYPELEEHSEGISVRYMDVVAQEAVKMLVDGWQPKRELTKNNGTRLDQVLDQVQPGKREVTLDVEGYTPEERERVIAAARARGLHVSGTRRWLLIRDLRGSGLTKNSGDAPTPAEFEQMVRGQLRIGDRQIRFHASNASAYDLHSGGPTTIFVDFFNLPEGVGGAGGGAERENNRLHFLVKFGPRHAGRYGEKAIAEGKASVELGASALPREYTLRKKTGTPEAIARYLADFLNKVVAEVPPKFTHTRR
jgi:hypothetical protein